MTLKVVAITLEGEDVAKGSRLLLGALGGMMNPPAPKSEEAESSAKLPAPNYDMPRLTDNR